MVIEVWEAKIKDGKTEEAVEFFRSWGASMPETHPRVLRPETGDLSKILLTQEFDSMAAREKAYDVTPEDRGKMLKKFNDCLKDLHNYYYKTADSY